MKTSFAPLFFTGFLAACGSSGTEVGTSLFFGAADSSASGNGLAFADGSQLLADTDGAPLKIKVARYLTDYATGDTSLVISDETVTFAVDDDGSVDTFTITIGDETLSFSGQVATDSNGRGWDSYVGNEGTYSGTGTVYSYSYGGNEAEAGALDTEAFFAFGFETDPADIAARMSQVTFDGTWFGYGGVVDETGALVASEDFGDGTITLIADFDADTIGGDITGSYENFGDVGGTISSTGIQGNGFLADMTLTTCATGFTCTSDSQAAGVFYGPSGDEITGVLGFDASRTDDATGDELHLYSGAGFHAEEVLPPL